MFLNPDYFFPIWIIIVTCNVLVLRNLKDQSKNILILKLYWPSLPTFHCSNIFFSHSQNNFGNKLPFLVIKKAVFWNLDWFCHLTLALLNFLNLRSGFLRHEFWVTWFFPKQNYIYCNKSQHIFAFWVMAVERNWTWH